MSKKSQSRTPHGATAMTAEQVHRLVGMRAAGGHGSHGDRRMKRQKTRQSQKRASLRDW